MDREDRLNFRSTLIAAFVANCSPRAKKGRGLQPHDIIPPLRANTKSDELNSVEDQVAALKMIFGSNAITTDVIPTE